jgi:putative transposase
MHEHRTYTASIANATQVDDDLDICGFSGSKLWNVALYYSRDRWETDGEIPDEDELKHELKEHEKYKDLHSQSSQRVLEELAEAFTSWYGKRDGGNGDRRANPPDYRKKNYYDADDNRVHEEHPRSTITWKQQGIRHDTKHGHIRLSKGKNHKAGPGSDYILCEYETRPDVTIENLQQVRAVYTRGRWELHLVCKHAVEMPDSPGNESAGIDLGICNFAAVAYSIDSADLYPGNALKEDNYYFAKEIAKCDAADSNRATRLHRTKSARQRHFIHGWATHVTEQCVANTVGDVYIGKLAGIREETTTGKAKNWGRHGNLDLHSWPFEKASTILEYKLKARGIDLHRVSERDTSKTCSCCDRERKANRVERGLYDCDRCRVAANSDVGGAENIRTTESNSESALTAGGDRSTGWLAQPAVYLYDRTRGFSPRATVVECKP